MSIRFLAVASILLTTACAVHSAGQVIPQPPQTPFYFVQTTSHPSSACNILTQGQIDTVDNTAWICVTGNPALLTGTWQQLTGGGTGSTNIFTNGTGTGIGPATFLPALTDTLRIFDNTATTGFTTLTLQAGVNQFSGSENIFQIQDNSGTNQSVVSWAAGFPYWETFAPINITTFGTYNVRGTGDTVARLKQGLDSGNPFISFGNGSNALDVGIERSGPQSLSITQGAAYNSYGNLALNNLTIHGTCTGCPSTSAITSLTGDVTASGPGAAAATLATVQAAPGTYGSSSQIPVVTVDGKGRVTTISQAALPSANYQTIEANGTPQTQRPKLNVAAGANVTITPSDNGTDTTTLTIAASGTGGGASLATQLLDFAPGTISSTSIPFGASCNSSTPCFVNLGGTQYSFTNTATLNLTGGTASDTIYYYVDGGGNRTMGFNSANTYTCTNCENAPASGITAFPAGSYPLYSCTVTTGAFTACADKRPILSATPLSNGLGTTIAQTAGVKAINVSEIPRAVTGTTDNLANTDCGNEVTYNNASAVAVALPQANLGNQFVAGCTIEVHNYGAGTVTITPTGSTIGGAANLTVATGAGQRITSDGANYQLGAGGGGGGLPLTGGTLSGNLTISFADSAPGDNQLAVINTTTSKATSIGFGSAWQMKANGSAQPNQDWYLWDTAHSLAAFQVDPSNDSAAFAGAISSSISSTSSNPVAFSATPAFDLSKGNLQTITLTGNVTSSTVTNLKAGQPVFFQVCQDATGTHTFAWPANVHGGMTVGSTASKCNVQEFISFDGNFLQAVTPGVTNQ